MSEPTPNRSPLRHPTGPGRRIARDRRPFESLVAAALMVAGLASGCVSLDGPNGAGTQERSVPERLAGEAPPPPEPQWGHAGDPGADFRASKRAGRSGRGARGFTYYRQDLMALRGQVAVRCSDARQAGKTDYLPELVSDLYMSGVDPAFAAEALIRGDCGSLAGVVRELVAQGGDQSVAPVIARALLLKGPNAESLIESAAEEGLDINLAAQGGGPRGGRTAAAYAMAYFPSGGTGRSLATADGVNSLYNDATPGFGLYTYVLLGNGFAAQRAADRARFDELMRVIETYVLASEDSNRGPTPTAHTFLIAVHPERSDFPLPEQTGPELSDPMRRDLVGYLRRNGSVGLAKRLEARPGPFLVSSLEPRLVPTERGSPRLIADLSGIGTEYLYEVVDAFDRPVPTDARGRQGLLDSIRARLLGLYSGVSTEGGASQPIGDAWVFRVGGPGTPRSGGDLGRVRRRAGESGVPGGESVARVEARVP